MNPERSRVGRLESEGAVDRVEALLGLEAIAVAHDPLSAAERDAAPPARLDGATVPPAGWGARAAA